MKTYSKLLLAFLFLILIVPPVVADQPPEIVPHIEYYENGKKESETRYNNGRRDGPVTEWHDNGQKQGEEKGSGLIYWAAWAEAPDGTKPGFAWRRPIVVNENLLMKKDFLQCNFGVSICLNDDGTRLLTGFADGETLLHDLRENKVIGTYNFNDAFKEDSPRRHIAPVSTSEAFFTKEGELCVVIAGGFRHPFRGLDGKMYHSPNETLVCRDSDFRKIYSWDAKQFPGAPNPTSPFGGGLNSDRTFHFSDDNKLVIDGVSKHRTMLVRESDSGRIVKQFKFDYPILSLAIGPMNKWCVVGIMESPLEEFDRDAFLKATKMVPGSAAQPLVAEERTKPVAVVNLESGKVASVKLGHMLGVNGVEILDDGKTCVSVSTEGMIVVWNIQNHKIIRRFWAGGMVSQFNCDPAGRYVAVGNSATVGLFDLDSGKVMARFQVATEDYKPTYPDVDDATRELHLTATELNRHAPQHQIADFSINQATKQIAVMYLDGLVEVWSYPDRVGKTQVIRRRKGGKEEKGAGLIY